MTPPTLRSSRSLPFRLFFVAAVAGVILAASVQTANACPPSQSLLVHPAPGEDAPTLEPGKAIERELAGGEAHVYQVTLEAGGFLNAVVDQRGIDVAVTVIGPDGKKIATVDSPNGTQGPELVELVAPTPGAYRLEVRSLDKKAERGRYQVKIEELLTAEQYQKQLAAVKSWLAKQAIALRSVEAGQGFEDLEPLKKLIGPARIVSLGEATHGTREFFQLKHRLLEFLVTEMGFTVFGIEATMPEGFDVNEYVLTGKGDPAKALAGLGFWVWDTEEVLDLIRWMRSYNADPRHTKKVKFYGFDMQSSPRAAKVALAYLRRVDPPAATAHAKTLAPLANPFLAPYLLHLPGEKGKAVAAAARALLQCFDDHKQDYVKKTSATEWAVARQHAQVLAQNSGMNSLGKEELFKEQLNVRDRAMADNVRWIVEHEGPGTKIVLWAHNGHAETAATAGWEKMGLHLRKHYGPDMVVFGFAFNQGSFQAMDMGAETGMKLRSFSVGPAPQGSLDAMLAASGLERTELDLRTLPKEGPVAAWFSVPRAMRYIGAVYHEQAAEAFLVRQKVQLHYDALLFVEKTTSARANKATGQRPESKPLAAPANLDFEDGAPGKLPPGWVGPVAIDGVSYAVVTDTEDPHTGKQCVLIRRTAGPHYGETFGQVAQVLDAKAFRGQRVKLRAAVRTDVAGVGNQAHLWLHASTKGLNPTTPLDNAADRPLTMRTWQVVEIVADVPKDAETINFGLALVGEGRAWLDSVSLEVISR